MRLLRAILIWTCLVPALACAQTRSIPGDAKRGVIRHLQETIVAIDGVEHRLAPGAQIRDEWNRFLVPVALRAGAQVKYLLDAEGFVRRVWVLTPEEAAKP